MQKRYLSDYALQLEGRKKKPVYRGKIYRLAIDGQELKRVKILGIAIAAALAAGFTALSFTDPGDMRQMYVILPWALEIVPLALIVCDAGRFLRRGPAMERARYEGSWLRIRWCTLVLAVLALASAAGLLVQAALLGILGIRGVISIIIAALECAGALRLHFGHKKIPVEIA